MEYKTVFVDKNGVSIEEGQVVKYHAALGLYATRTGLGKVVHLGYASVGVETFDNPGKTLMFRTQPVIEGDTMICKAYRDPNLSKGITGTWLEVVTNE